MIDGSIDSPLPLPVPVALTLTNVVVPVARSRTNTSVKSPLVSLATRSVAVLVKAT